MSEPLENNLDNRIKPDYNAVIWRPNHPIHSTDLDEIFLSFDEERERYKKVNWWGWSTDKWETFLSQNKGERTKQGDNYEEHPHERILISYARWRIANPDAEDEEMYQKLSDFTTYHNLFWRWDKEVPDYFALDDKIYIDPL